jgi:hypothetical protein
MPYGKSEFRKSTFGQSMSASEKNDLRASDEPAVRIHKELSGTVDFGRGWAFCARVGRFNCAGCTGAFW